jgi:hypothetical protein
LCIKSCIFSSRTKSFFLSLSQKMRNEIIKISLQFISVNQDFICDIVVNLHSKGENEIFIQFENETCIFLQWQIIKIFRIQTCYPLMHYHISGVFFTCRKFCEERVNLCIFYFTEVIFCDLKRYIGICYEHNFYVFDFWRIKIGREQCQKLDNREKTRIYGNCGLLLLQRWVQIKISCLRS